MRNDKRLQFAVASLGMVAIIAASPWAAAASGKLMHMTMHMTMQMGEGMPAMPPRSMEREVCMPTGKFDPQAMQRATSRGSHGMCHVEHLARRGDHLSYDMVCQASAMVANSHAEVQLQGEDAYTGKVHSTMSTAGHAMTMDMDYSAKRVGNCDYTPPAS